jgi:hypothetical protein
MVGVDFLSYSYCKRHRLPAGALDFETCLFNNFPEKVLMEDHHGGSMSEN